MKRLNRLLVLLVLLIISYSCFEKREVNKKRTEFINEIEVYYTCSMHPRVKENENGKCPICHMNLTKVEIKNNYSSNVASSFAKKKTKCRKYH